MGIIRHTLSNAVKAAQIATGITLGLGSFWLVYSKLAVDHNAPFAPAVDAEQDTVPTRGGRMAYYADRSAAAVGLGTQHQRRGQRL